MKKSIHISAVLAAAALMALSCGGPNKVTELERRHIGARLVLPEEGVVPELEYRQPSRDTIIVKDESGRDVILMKAVPDERTGEMVATDVIRAATVTARFRNVAERAGRVDLRFQIIVPAELQDSRWQLRFFPDMFVLEDSIRLDPVVITGRDYRRAQLKGYQQYERFLSKIVSDTTRFINIGQLEIFLERNIPQVFAFKSDSSEVSDEVFYSCYGVSEHEAVEHYTNRFAKRRNARRIRSRESMFRKYVKAPIVSEGIRLDTVMQNVDGDFVYEYVQSIRTRPKLRRVDIVLSGDIREQDRKVYDMPRSEPLTFYISTLSSFADETERYVTRVVERRAEAGASYRIEFDRGRSDIRPDLSDNLAQIGFVKDNLIDLLRNEVFDLDSIVVTANASPEGSWVLNGALSRRRGEAVVRYFESFMDEYRRRAGREGGFSVDEGGRMTTVQDMPRIRFTSRSVPENWGLLDRLVREDGRLTEAQKERYFLHGSVADRDRREALMRGDDYYPYLADSLYPRLRVVDFAFHLHRKGMVKDTVHTTELDGRYMEGVRLLRDMDYEEAVKILGPYRDYNAAVAYMAAGRNASAMQILGGLDRTARVCYLLAVLHSRGGDEQEAVRCYLDACRKDPSYVHRGNLDPEISRLIRLYGLNRQEDDADGDGY